MKKIYLDYAASTPVDPEVFEAMRPYFIEKYGNPSSVHFFGQEAQVAVDVARDKVASVLGCASREVIFTGSASEANNMALFGVLRMAAERKEGLRVITTSIEHESVLETLKAAERQLGAQVTFLPVSKEGLVRVEDFRRALSDDVALVSVIYANNEIGTIQPIREISQIIADYKKEHGGTGPLFHTDAVQAANHLPLSVSEPGADLMTLSGHKMYGPKGVGALYAKRGVELVPLVFGSGQEYGKRSGTENVPYIVGFAAALAKAAGIRGAETERVQGLQKLFLEQAARKIPRAVLNGSRTERLPSNVNMLFPGSASADMLIALDAKGIAASAGAACQSKALAESHVLTAIGLSKKEAKSSLRFTFGRYTTEEDVEKTVAVLAELVK